MVIKKYAVVYLLLYQLQQALLVGAAEVVDGGKVSPRVRRLESGRRRLLTIVLQRMGYHSIL